MKLAVGLPNWLPATPGPALVQWARRAEEIGFSSLGTIGRTVFDSHEELVALAACAGATRTIRLATTLTISPTRETVLLAKQAVTLDAISGGRLSLGLGVGWREDDFRATGTADRFARRGSVLAGQIATLRRVWSGGKLDGIDAPIGPAPARAGGPELLLGGYTPAALRRTGRLADGLLALAAPAPVIAEHYRAVESAWREADRPGRPRLVAARYFALGDDARARAETNVRAYYAFGGEGAVRGVLAGMITNVDAARANRDELAALGVDETFFWATNADPAQLERLAKAVL